MPLSPMLVQYLVGLCALKWDANAVDVTIGAMVPHEAVEKPRDVDVTVTVDTPEGRYAFKDYEVKHEGSPLDAASVAGPGYKTQRHAVGHASGNRVEIGIYGLRDQEGASSRDRPLRHHEVDKAD